MDNINTDMLVMMVSENKKQLEMLLEILANFKKKLLSFETDYGCLMTEINHVSVFEGSLLNEKCAEIAKKINRIDYEILLNIYQLYECSHKVKTANGFLNDADAENMLRILEEQVEGIKAWFYDGKLYITMPLLPHNFSNYKLPVLRQYFNFFKYGVDRAIRNINNFSEKDKELFKNKHIHYLFVVRNNLTIRDNDNYDTKGVTDGIVMSLPGGDSAYCCSFSYSSSNTEDLPEGTYITVTPLTKANTKCTQIIEKFKAIKG